MRFKLHARHVAQRHCCSRQTLLAATLILTAFNLSAATLSEETAAMVSAVKAKAAKAKVATEGEAERETVDKVDVYVAERVTTDNNVFLVANNRQSDTYSTTTAGLNVDKTFSRQRFLANASLDLVRYNRFTELNYNGYNANAVWLWELGNDWSGQLGYAERKSLAGYSNFSGRSNNELKIQRAHVDAAYLLTPSWQLRAGIAEQAQRNSEQNREVNDVDVQTLGMAVNYISPASTELGIGFTQVDGRPLNRQIVGALSYSNAYTQRAIDVHADWPITVKSQLKARLAHVTRDYDQLAYRDYDGTTFQLTYDWQATEKLALSVLAQRDISLDEDIQTSFVLIEGVAFRPSYDLSEKIRLSASADFSTRKYLGDSGLAPDTMFGREDRVRMLSAAVSYRPIRSLTLLLSGRRETRSSDYRLADYDYHDNVFSLSARFTF